MIHLSALLTGEALCVYTRLTVEESIDYKKVKAALLKRFQLTEEGFRHKFRESKAVTGENPGQFITRLGNYFDRWIEMSGVSNDFESVRALMLREQFTSTCSKELAVYLQEKPFTGLTDMADQADRFLQAHGKDLSISTKPDGKSATRK